MKDEINHMRLEIDCWIIGSENIWLLAEGYRLSEQLLVFPRIAQPKANSQ